MRPFSVRHVIRLPLLLLALQLVSATEVASQQTGTISGVVRDGQSGQLLPTVQVYIQDLDIGTLSQANGRYVLTDVPAGPRTVSVQRIGYRGGSASVTVAAGATVVQDFTLAEEALQLDEIIVTGTPGGTQRRAIGNSVVTVDASDITRQVAIATTQNLLTVRASGLQLQRANNNVGGGVAMTIRGASSFSQDRRSPLIYVDGVRVSNDQYAGPTLQGGGGEANTINDINPADIESIEIIKGPAAATLYGTEASAGVIQIITKRGQEGAPQWDMSVRMGSNFIIDPASKIGRSWGCRTSVTPPCAEADMFQYDIYDYATQQIADGFFPWPTDNLYSNGRSQSYDLSVRGGTPAVRYFFSGNFSDDVGPLWYNTDERYGLRANVTAAFTDNLTMDVSSSWLSGDTRYGEPVDSEQGILRVTKLSSHECLPEYAGPPVDCSRRGAFQDFRPDDIADVQTTRGYERFIGSATLNHTVGGWLTQRAVFGLDRRWDTNQVYVPRITTKTPTLPTSVQGILEREQPTETNISADYSLSARYELNPVIRLTTSAGVQYNERITENIITNGRNFPTGVSSTINQTALALLVLNYNYVQNKSLGMYVQEEVSWNDRVFVTGAVRLDDNSAFGANFSAQKYPKISATWVVSEESFWGIEPINSLRLRGAWGKAGRQPSTLAGINTYTTRPGIAGRTAISPSSPGNAIVGPEVSTELELGFDVAALDDRISGEFTYFTKTTEDALLGVAVPTSLGFPGSIQSNVGRIDNWGWEASLRARVYESPAFAFDLDLTGDHIMNEIVDLGSDYPGSAAIRVGMPYPNVRTQYHVLSADLVPVPGGNNTFANAMCDSGIYLGSDDLPQSQRAVTFGGPPIPCSPAARRDHVIGPSFPTYTWSITPTITLFQNALQLYGTAEGSYGRWHQDSIIEWACAVYRECRISWLRDDPIYLAGCHQNCPYPDETIDHYHKGDFWRMREVGARYTLPEFLVSKIRADQASLSFSARDIWLIYRRHKDQLGVPIVDPDQGSNSENNDANYWRGPTAASMHMTLRVTF